MGLRTDPMGGGQFQQALKTILEVERQPIKNLEARKEVEAAKMKLFQEFKAKFQGLDKSIQEVSTLKKFRDFKVDLGDGSELVSVNIDKEKAQPGSYMVDIQSIARRAGMISNAFEDPEEQNLGIGYITMYLENGDTFDIFVDQNNASLSRVANLINSTENAPVRASVIRDSTDPERPYRLLVTAKKTGEQYDIEFPEIYFLDGKHDFSIEDDRLAENAVVLIDDFEIELESNEVTDFLPGVNLALKQARPDKPFMLTITEDYAKVSGKMKDLVDQVNGVLEFINKQNQIDDKTDTRGTFAGDTILQTIEWRIRNLMHEGFGARDPNNPDEFKVIHLHDLGVNFQKNGSLSFNEEKFQTALQKDFDTIAEAISGEMGFAFQIRKVVENYTRSVSGLLAARERNLKSRIDTMDKNIEEKERLYERKAQGLTDKFAKLQGTLANLQRQQSSVQATMGGGGGGIQQLMGG